MKICKVEACNCEVYGEEYCNKHYRQFKRYGEIKRTLKDSNEIVLQYQIFIITGLRMYFKS